MSIVSLTLKNISGMNYIVMSHSQETPFMQPPPVPVSSNEQAESSGTEKAPQSQQHKLTSVVVESEVVALNLLVQFLGLAQRRGAFTIDEAAKIWECVQKFQKPIAESDK